MIELKDTGERILTEKETPLMISRHFKAYKFAGNFVKDKEVLDIGCVEGYGSFYLAGLARNVLGIDYKPEVINYARYRYQRNNLSFETMDIKDLSLLSRKFDIICSFQVIEHIFDAGCFLKSVTDLLHDNGVFICSTPNRLDASPHSYTPLNKYHVKEYLYLEFISLLNPYFKKVDMSGIKRGARLNFYRRLKKIGIFNFLPENLNPVKKFYASINSDNFVIATDKLDKALDFIAVCKK